MTVLNKTRLAHFTPEEKMTFKTHKILHLFYQLLCSLGLDVGEGRGHLPHSVPLTA